MRRRLGAYMALLGLAIAIASLAIFIYISYFTIDRRFYDDKISWYHIHIIKYIASGNNPRNDTYLWFGVGKDLTRSPILLDEIVASIAGASGASSVGYLTLAMGILTGIMTMAIAYIVFRDVLTAAIALSITMLMPVSIYWFKYTNYGAYIMLPLALLVILLISLAMRSEGRRAYITIAAMAAVHALLWLSWSAGWVIPLVLGLYMMVLMYTGLIDKRIVYIGAIVFITSAALLSVTKYFTVYHLFSLTLLALATVFSMIEYIYMRGIPKGFKRNLWRLLSIAFTASLSVLATLAISEYISLPGLQEVYSKQYNPITEMFPIVVLAPFALVIYLRSRMLKSVKENSLEILLVITFLVSVIGGYIEPPLAILVIATIAPFITFALTRVALFLYREYTGRIRILSLIVIAWVLVGVIGGGVVGAYKIAEKPPQIYYSGITPSGHGYKPVNESGLAKVLELVPPGSIVITCWDRSHWITGLKNVYTLADDHGPDSGKRLISLIMISDEETARALIMKNIYTTKYSVYILVTEIITLDKTALGTALKAAHIGRAFSAGAAQGGLPQMIYIPFGDIAMLFQYVSEAGKQPKDYINYNLQAPVQSALQLPLAWNDKARNSLLVLLVANAITSIGWRPTNDLISRVPLTFPSLKYFKLVKTSLVRIDTITTRLGEYDICVLVALYQFIPPTQQAEEGSS